MKLHPLHECVTKAEPYIAKGVTAYQQFLCASCGAKQTMETPNVFYESGICEACGARTDILKDGCNWAAHFRIGAKA